MQLDQHFLIDENICIEIVKLAAITEADEVLEIGGGKGSLTRHLPKCNATICELDKELASQLEKKFPGMKVIQGDGLEIIENVKFDVLVSAVPYSIAEPLMQALFIIKFRTAVLVLPRKFAQRLTEKSSTIGIIADAFLDARACLDVPRSAFDPVPDVDSTALLLTPKKEDSVIRQLWLQKDKKAKNALREALVRLHGLTMRQAEGRLSPLPKPLGEVLVSRLDESQLALIRDTIS